jgi:hypothetical protein
VEGDSTQSPVSTTTGPVDIACIPVEKLIDLFGLQIDQIKTAVALALLTTPNN